MEVFLTDYRKFDGVWLATKITQVLDSPDFGKGTQTWIYDKIEHNVKIPVSLFAMPEGLKDTKEK